MADVYLSNFVLEQTNAPGTGTINLGGPVAGRVSFSSKFANGSRVFGFLDDGSQFEAFIGTLTTSTSPNTISRDVVVSNSANTTNHLNFTGTTRIYNELPAQQALWRDASGAITLTSTGSAAVSGSGGLTGTSLTLNEPGSSQSTLLIHGGSAGAGLKLAATASIAKTLYCGPGGNFNIANSAGTGTILTLTDAGVLSTTSTISGIGTVTATNTSAGYAALTAGDASHTGYCAFFNASGTRQGYLGFCSGATMNLVCEGSATTLALTGSMSISGTLNGQAAGFASLSTSGAITAGTTLYANSTLGVVGAATFSSTLTVGGAIQSNTSITSLGAVTATGYQSRAGTSGPYTGNMINHYWQGSYVALYVDNSLIGAISTSSDATLKHSIDLLEAGALDKIGRLRPVRYRWKTEGIRVDDGQDHLGFLAQDVREVIPEAVVAAEGQPLSLDDRAVIAVLVKAVQELSWKVGELEAKRIL